MTSPPCPRSAPSAKRSSPARRTRGRLSSVLIALALLAGCGSDDEQGEASADRFDSAAAFELINEQVAVGQRPAGSPQLRALAERLRAELPNGSFEEVPGGLRNVVGSLPGPTPAILIGAHYDTDAHPPGFVGANDSAAGTAAVVELARTLQRDLPEGHREVRFVLFDGEEEPLDCPGAGFEQCALRGSKAYVATHSGEGQVGEMILLDYIANKGLQIPREGNSDEALWAKLRAAAVEIKTEQYFPGGEQTPILDDHLPFIAAGVPSIDLIDFSYEHADTVEDTPDKLDPAALDAVGETVAELVLVEAGP